MFNPFEYFKTTALVLLTIWTAVIFLHHTKTGELKFSKFPFSIKNYNLIALGLLSYPLLFSLWHDSFKPLLLFILLGFAGMTFEILASRWWNLFFKTPFYSYRVKTIDNKSSSWLNLAPWGAGAMVYFAVAAIIQTSKTIPAYSQTGNTIPIFFLFLIIFSACLALQAVIWAFIILKKNGNHKFKKLKWGNGIFWTFPFFVTAAVCASIYGPIIVWLAILFAVFGTFAEYLFGKTCEFLISKKLWVYNHLSFDNGHFSPVAALGFSMAGMYFWMLGLLIQALIP